MPEATGRVARLADEDLVWVEEPTRAEDVIGAARIRAEAPTPIQLVETGRAWPT